MSAIKSETVTHMIIVLGTLVAQIEMSHKTIPSHIDISGWCGAWKVKGV